MPALLPDVNAALPSPSPLVGRRLRLGFVLADFPLVSETFVIDQIEAMLRHGFDVGIVCDRQRPPPDGALDTLMPLVRTRWVAGRVVRALHDRLPARLRGHFTGLADAVCDAGLNRFDVLVAHFGWLGLRLAKSASLGVLRRPFATFLHGYDLAIPYNSGGMAAYAPLFRHGDLLLPVCDLFRDMLLRSGAAPWRMAIVPMGVDCDAIAFEARPRRPGAFAILSTARLVDKKGLDDGLRAFGRLARERPGLAWTYEVIGEGPLRPALVALAAAEGIADRVRFPGALPHAEVKRRLRHADLFLLPSRTAANGDMESMPVVLKEAMAAGVPLVSTTHSGIPELVTHGVTGLLAGERDPAGLATQIAWAADNPDGCAALAHAARAHVAQAFDATALNDRLAGLLRGLVQRDTRRPETAHV